MSEEESDRGQPITSTHAVTEKWRCYAMEEKYGWTLLEIKPNGTKDLPYDCIFEGETDFPNYMEGSK